MALAPSPVVALNRAVAVAEVDGPEPALGLPTPSQRTWTATTCCTPSAPTCCAGSAAPPTRPWPTTPPSTRTANTAERDLLERRSAGLRRD